MSAILSEIAAGLGLSLAQAARRLPSTRLGKPVSPSCLWRWVHDGITLSDGRCVRLEAARLAGRWLTTEAAIERFLAAQTPATDAPPVSVRTPTQRQRASDRAAKELESLGI